MAEVAEVAVPRLERGLAPLAVAVEVVAPRPAQEALGQALAVAVEVAPVWLLAQEQEPLEQALEVADPGWVLEELPGPALVLLVQDPVQDLLAEALVQALGAEPLQRAPPVADLERAREVGPPVLPLPVVPRVRDLVLVGRPLVECLGPELEGLRRP